MATTASHPSARDHCLAPNRPVDAPLVAFEGRYGRLFPDLPGLGATDARLLALGVDGGACDGGEELTEGAEAAGWPIFGQFVAHDITADRSPLAVSADIGRIGSFRSPRANLESVYGAGPVGSPYLFDRSDQALFLIGVDDHGSPGDVPRNAQGTALLGDPRNDVHFPISQMHLAFLQAHNLIVERLREDGVPESECFSEARRATVWHYQWVIVNDFLPRLVGKPLVDDILTSGPRHFRPDGEVFIPVEFADAAYRYGHSQMRQTYRLNQESGEVTLFPDLIGFRPVPSDRAVDWTMFFGDAAQAAARIDGRLPRSLIRLPHDLTGDVDVDAYTSLASRDLQRGRAMALPSGEAVAHLLGVDPLTRDEVGLAAEGWEDETPLWFYVLREADVRESGNRLGPVGGRIVAEVLVGIINRDPESYRAVDPGWQPTLPSRGDRFELLDLLSPPDH